MPHPGDVGFHDSYAAFLGGRTKRGKTSYLVADLVSEYDAALDKRDLAANTKSLYRLTGKRIVEQLGDFPVNDLEPEDVQYVIDNKVTTAGSANIFISVLGAIYTWARQRGKTKLEPTKDIKKFKLGEHQPWPESVLVAGLNANDDRTRLAINLLYYTGQRISDVVKMRWSDILDGEIHVRQKKTSKEVSPPLHYALAEELARTPKRGITILVDQLGKPVTEDVIRRELKDFSKKAGHECVPHGLRKNAVIALLEAGCTVAEVAAITGQTFQVVEQYASKVNRRKLGKAAILKLENITRPGKPLGKLENKS